MISAYDYYRKIAKPTVDAFLFNNGDIRLAFLACMATLHVIDYVTQNKAPSPEEGERWVREFCAGEKSFAFQVVKAFATASKHC
jgi:hypothetical protein